MRAWISGNCTEQSIARECPTLSVPERCGGRPRASAKRQMGCRKYRQSQGIAANQALCHSSAIAPHSINSQAIGRPLSGCVRQWGRRDRSYRGSRRGVAAGHTKGFELEKGRRTATIPGRFIIEQVADYELSVGSLMEQCVVHESLCRERSQRWFKKYTFGW
jgi:hypothetical protein